jgi:hypothetical protein
LLSCIHINERAATVANSSRKNLGQLATMDDQPEVDLNMRNISDLVLNNFAVVSAAATVLVACIVMAFLYAYLSIFDESLIWLIEYTDIIKFCLVGVAIISGIVFTPFTLFDVIRKWSRISQNRRRFIAWITVIWIVIIPIIIIIKSRIDGDPALSYNFELFFTRCAVLLLSYHIYKSLERNIGYWEIIELGVALVIVCGAVGRTYGLWLRDVSNEKHIIVAREQNGYLNELPGAKLIFVTSHHTVIQERDNIIAILSADVTQIISNNAPTSASNPKAH